MKNVILDLDETLIYCPSDVLSLPRHALQLRIHHVFLDGEFHVIVERPFLREFLRGLQGKKIAIWTAAEKEYAEFIVHHILEPHLAPNQRFEFVWHRDHVNVCRQKYGITKHLDMAAQYFRPSETVIVDDNQELLKQKRNVFVIKNFTADNIDDAELLKVLDYVNYASIRESLP